MPDFTAYRLGALPSPLDHRDYHVASLASPLLIPLPPRIDYPMQAVLDQGIEGSCEGHALAGAVGSHQIRSNFNRIVSRRDAYQGARQLEPVTGEGANIRAGLKYAQQTGLCLETDWPYIAEQTGQAGPSAVANRALNKIASYASVDIGTIDGIKAGLAHQGSPLIVRIPVFTGFYKPTAAGTVTQVGTLQGYHAVVLRGYDDGMQAFRLRNSWGTTWGQAGECWYPYGLTVNEAWTLTPAFTNASAPKPWWAVFLPWLA